MMIRPDSAVIRASLAEQSVARIERIDVFAEIDSTNTFLNNQPPPSVGKFNVAIAGHQTAGRGRRNREWISEPGASLCLSISYTFERTPQELPSLTLSLGVAVAEALQRIGIADVQLKWPNDVLVSGAKLGGILTESKVRGDEGVTVVAGTGLNLKMPSSLDASHMSDWAHSATDVQSVLGSAPDRDQFASMIIDALIAALREFETLNIRELARRYRDFDYLAGRTIVAGTPDGDISGVADGIDACGALVVQAANGERHIITGSIQSIGDPVST